MQAGALLTGVSLWRAHIVRDWHVAGCRTPEMELLHTSER